MFYFVTWDFHVLDYNLLRLESFKALGVINESHPFQWFH
jgi:hypothetical protein